MNIIQAWIRFGNGREFVDWCFSQKYDYFIKIGPGKHESGWFWSKGKKPKQYKFNY